MTGVEPLALLKAGMSAAGKAAFKKSFETMVAKCTEQGIDTFRKQKGKTIPKADQVLRHMLQIRSVKTLWQVDHAVDISTFYCDSRVYVGNKRSLISSIGDFPTKNVLIEGIAGQGKSIFLRYLAAVELGIGGPIPVYIELRRASDSSTLIDLILLALKEYGLIIDQAAFETMARLGQVTLMLDALDEVLHDSKQKVIGEIEHLAKTHPDMRICVTARLNSGLEVSPLFQVVRLSDLEGNEYKQVICKLIESTTLANNLINRIASHRGEVQQLLKTPLLVTLLVINYKSFQEIPEQLSDFYEQLFYVLLRRHDGTKPGYQRQRHSKLNDTECRRCFETFCFLAKQQHSVLSYELVSKTASDALAHISVKDDPEKFIQDIVGVTCLLVKDGEEYRFIHKSVQEFYAASWMRQRPEASAARIYQRMFATHAWTQELLFLKEIDSYRFYRFGLIPAILEYLYITQDDLTNKNFRKAISGAEKRLGSGGVLLEVPQNINSWADLEIGRDMLTFAVPHLPTCTDVCLSPLARAMRYGEIFDGFRTNIMGIEVPRTGFFRTTLSELAAKGMLADSLTTASRSIARSLMEIGIDGMAIVRKAEADSNVDFLFAQPSEEPWEF